MHPLNTILLADRTRLLKPSPTLAMTAKARRMKAEGLDVVSFAAGEPDFNTPEPVVEAAIRALHAGQTKYTPSSGIPALKEAVVEKLWRENQLKASPDQVVVSCGAKHSLYNALQVLINPGDEVILLAPYWMTYADQVQLAGGAPVVVPTRSDDGFVPDASALRAAISPRTRALIVNSPSNPTGAVLPRSTLKEIAALALRHDLWILSDEIYERLTYTERVPSIATLGAEVAARTLVINGCSKSYSMTGWRIGYCVAPAPVATAISNLQDQVTSNPTSFAQAGAVEALHLPADTVEAMRVEFQARRDLIVQRLRAIPGLTVPEPQGAFYVFPDVSAFLGGDLHTDVALADHLLETAHIATVPGSVFEGAGHLRLSYACSREDIEKGIGRLESSLTALRASR